MSFLQRDIKKGTDYKPGYFLAHEDCTRITHQFKADDENVVTAENGGKYIPMGSVIKDTDGNLAGIAYEDVDVTFGDMPASLVVNGIVYKDRLNNVTDASDLSNAGFTVIDNSPTVERPSAFDIADIDLPTVDEAETETTGDSTEKTEG